jgi:predicted amidohydrolase YtcJ
LHGRADADLIVVGRVLTGDPRCPAAEAIAVSAGRIVRVGETRDVLAERTGRTRVLGGPGTTVVPGFVDAHLHFLALVRRSREVDCSAGACATIDDLLARIADAAGDRPAGEWIRGFGYDEFFLAEGRHPNRGELDRAAPRNPVRLLHRTGHAAVLSSLAFAALGRATVADGLVHEPHDRLPPIVTGEPDDRDVADSAAAESSRLLRRGITTFHDPTADAPADSIDLLRRLVRGGSIRQRVRVFAGSIEEKAPGDDDAFFRQAGVKLVVPESGEPAGLRERAVQAANAGSRLAIHAVEPAAISVALDVLRSVPGRHRVEHASLCPPPLAAGLAEVGATVVTHPAFLFEFGDKYRSEVDADQWPWLYPLRSLLAAGVRLAFGSDAPIASPHPLANIRAAGERRTRAGVTIAADEKIDGTAALAAHTRGGASAGGDETLLGRIAPGFAADLAVLTGDPTECPAEEIGGIEIQATVIAGEVAWER